MGITYQVHCYQHHKTIRTSTTANMSAVYIANLSPTTSKESLDKFMAFCGSIQSIEMQEGNRAIVTFEKPSAASTALMLNGGTLDGSPIQVSSELVDEDTPSIVGEEHYHDDIPQEAKPRTAIVAEYLASGYILSEGIINKAVAFDQKNGISRTFLDFFRKLTEQARTKAGELDQQAHISEKAQADDKVHLTEKAKNAWQVGKSYYSKVLTSEFGQQAQSFYTQTSNNIKSVHEEASRIAADKKNAAAAASDVPSNNPEMVTATPTEAAKVVSQPVAPGAGAA